MKKLKKIILGILLVSFAVAGYGFYLVKKKPADTREMPPLFTLSAALLVNEFNKDETAAGQKYLDKVIAVNGSISGITIDLSGTATVILDSGDPMASVTCSFYDEETETVKKFKKGSVITVKGKCTGKLMDVILNKCSIEK